MSSDLSNPVAPQILFATDFAEPSRRALACVKHLAHLRNASVRAFHVIDIVDVDDRSWFSVRDSAERRLRDVRRELRLAGIANTATVISGGTASQAIHAAVVKYKPELLVLGLHGERMIMGPSIGATALGILRKSRYPVITVGPQAHAPEPAPESASGPFARVLFVTDVLRESLSAVLRAWPVAKEQRAPLLAVLPPSRINPNFSLGRWKQFASIRLLPGDEAAGIVLAELVSGSFDLLVVGIRAGRYMDALLGGATLHTLISQAPCPVLTMRS